MLELMRWISRYYLAPLGQVLETAIPTGVRNLAGSRLRTVLFPGPQAADARAVQALPVKQRAVMQVLLQAAEPLTMEQLRERARCSAAPIQALRSSGFIQARQERVLATPTLR
ncbi:MAG: primosomal protein N', partial [Planctomycetota bacterium]